jgi:hypothetical protein
VITDIWNIKHCRTKLPLSMYFVELKPALNNKDIFKVEYIQQCKTIFKPPKHKRDIVQCANCQRYGHFKNYCHLKPRWSNAQVTTSQTSTTEKKALLISNVSSVVEIFLRITRGIRSTKTYKRKHNNSLFDSSPHKSNKPYSINRE